MRQRCAAAIGGRLQACRYFFLCELPRVDAQLDLLASLDATTLDMQQDWF